MFSKMLEEAVVGSRPKEIAKSIATEMRRRMKAAGIEGFVKTKFLASRGFVEVTSIPKADADKVFDMMNSVVPVLDDGEKPKVKKFVFASNATVQVEFDHE